MTNWRKQVGDTMDGMYREEKTIYDVFGAMVAPAWQPIVRLCKFARSFF